MHYIAERRILIIGSSGNGKSASANTIIRQKVFESRASDQSVTKKSQFRIMEENDKQYLVVDTPTLFGASNDGYSIRELAKIIGITYPGFHVLIVVIKIGRFTEEEKNTFRYIERIFGSEVFETIVILFTGLDNLEADDMQFHDYINNHIRSELKYIIFSKCGGRVVGFNNRADETNRNSQVNELLRMVECVYERNRYRQPIFHSSRLDLPIGIIESFFDKELLRRYEINESKRTAELHNEIRLEIQSEHPNTHEMLDCLAHDPNMLIATHNGDESWWGRLFRFLNDLCAIV